jgi:hypothetical protein
MDRDVIQPELVVSDYLVVNLSSIASSQATLGCAGRQGRQPMRAAARLVSIRSHWSLVIVRSLTIFPVGIDKKRLGGMQLSMLIYRGAGR